MDAWSMRRVQLGSEWQRVQLKLKLLKRKNAACNEYVNAHNNLIRSFNAKLVKSTQLIEQLEEQAVSLMPTEKAAIEALSSELQECVAVIKASPATATASTTTASTNATASTITATATNTTRVGNLSTAALAKSDRVSFDDDALRSVARTLAYFRRTLFRTTCLCGRKRKRSSVARHRTCIFCHLFRAYENARSFGDEQEEADMVARPDLKSILVEHSYCKQPRAEKRSHKKAKAKLVDFDDGLLLDKVVNERLARLFESKKANKTTKTSLFDDDYELDVKQDQMIETGFEITANEIKKLPNLSYEE